LLDPEVEIVPEIGTGDRIKPDLELIEDLRSAPAQGEIEDE